MESEALVEFGKPLKRIKTDTPTPQGKEVLIKVTYGGVCHSDVHIHDGYFDLGGGNQLPLGGTMSLPHTLGHEIEGEVVSVGDEVKDIKLGENVVVFPWIGCGKCPTCHAGDEHLCNAPRQLGIQLAGGFSDYCLVPDEKYLLDYSGIKPGLAATYMCSGLTAFGALKKINNVNKDDHILILGLGGVGMMGLQFAFMMGGAIVVENIFSWNGVGRMAVEAIFQRDYPIIQGFILTFAVVVVIVSIFLDTIYAFIDPRIRRG